MTLTRLQHPIPLPSPAIATATHPSLPPSLKRIHTMSSALTRNVRSAVASSSRVSLRRSMATVTSRGGPAPAKGPTGVVMMNMGGPSTIPEVHDFLSRLFHDHDLIPLPMQSLLAPYIARRRTPKIEKQYTAIGGGSPILRWTKIQGKEMCELLDELNPESAPHKPYVAFRYAKPLTEDMLEEMRRDGVKRAVAFSQYPQYSCSTTGSSLNELYAQSAKEGGIEWSVLDRWPTHPGLVDAVAHNIRKALEKYPAETRDKVVLLFSAHSLPMEIVNRGDPYTPEVAATVHAVMTKLGFSNPYRLSWQSQVGPKAWQGPQTSDSVEGLAKRGHKDVCLIPIAFTSDHIETLYELDVEIQEEAEKLGMNLTRAESMNDSPIFIRAIADLVSNHLKEYEAGTIGATSKQVMLRCPQCTNPKCGKTKEWLSTGGQALQV